MEPMIKDFLEYLNSTEFEDYGDFKREVDLHLRELSESLHPLTVEQSWHLRRLREQLLWMYNNNIEEVRSYLTKELMAMGTEYYARSPYYRGGVEL